MPPTQVGKLSREKFRQGQMVSKENLESHQLSQTASSFPSCTVLCKQHHYPPKDEQCHGSDIHKQNGGYPFTGTLPASLVHMEVVSATEYISNCRTLPRATELSCRQGIKDMKDCCIQSLMRPLEIDLFASHLTKQLPRFTAGGQTQCGEYKCFQSELV